MKTLTSHDLDQNPGDGTADRQSAEYPDTGCQTAFESEQNADLTARQPQVAQQTELPTPRGRERGKAGGHTGQTNDDGGGLQNIGHGEGAIEDSQADGAYLTWHRDLQCTRTARRLECLGHAERVDIGRQPDGGVLRRVITGQTPVIGEIQHETAGLARIVTPDPGDPDGRLGSGQW